MKTKLIHHSLADWDMPGDCWQLTAIRFISPPSCVRAYSDLGTGWVWIFLKDTIAPNLPDGRIISNLYHPGGAYAYTIWSFRAQALPIGIGIPNSIPSNCYHVTITRSTDVLTYIRISKRLNQIEEYLYSGTNPDWPVVYKQWTKWRITWYSYQKTNITRPIRIIIDGWKNDEWQQCVQFDHEPNLWELSPVNLVGITSRGGAYDEDDKDCIDDTEIYKKAT